LSLRPTCQNYKHETESDGPVFNQHHFTAPQRP
jgi:hypothetical protein